MSAAVQWLAPRFDRIPPELRAMSRWVCWRAVRRGNGTAAKVPFTPNGRAASVSDPATWSTFDACRAAHAAGGFAGVGLVLDGQPVGGRFLIGFDFDRMTRAKVRPATLTPLLRATYVELSPSGEGVRAFGWARAPRTLKLDARDDWPGVEIYASARYLTVTGCGEGAMGDVDEMLDALMEELEAHPARARARGVQGVGPRLAEGLAEGLAALPAAARAAAPAAQPAPPLDMARLRAAVLYLARSGLMAGENGWTQIALSLAREAHRHPPHAEALWALLDEASAVAGGHYDPDENRKRFERHKAQAALRVGFDSRTVFRIARDAGWADAPQQPAAGPVCVASLPLPQRRRWLHGADAVRGAVSLVVAPGGRGKTAFLLGMALACATGRDLLGAKVYAAKGGLRVLYVNAEDGTDEIARRVHAALALHGLTPADAAALFLAGADRERLALLVSGQRGEARLGPGLARLRELVRQVDADLVILDPLANLSEVTLNDNAGATMLMAALTACAVEQACGIIVAHHAAKGRPVGDQDAASGAAAIVNAARISLALERASADDAAALGVRQGDVGRFFHVIQAKANLTPPASARRWFELRSTTLPNAAPPLFPEGDSVHAAVPFTPDPLANPFPPAAINAALHAIATADPPLSPDKRAGARWAVPAITAALARAGQDASEATARDLLARLRATGAVVEKQVAVPKPGGGGGANMRLGLVVADAGAGEAGGVPRPP
jgi:hypothetical protein